MKKSKSMSHKECKLCGTWVFRRDDSELATLIASAVLAGMRIVSRGLLFEDMDDAAIHVASIAIQDLEEKRRRAQ
jgi:hypothetical protein